MGGCPGCLLCLLRGSWFGVGLWWCVLVMRCRFVPMRIDESNISAIDHLPSSNFARNVEKHFSHVGTPRVIEEVSSGLRVCLIGALILRALIACASWTFHGVHNAALSISEDCAHS